MPLDIFLPTPFLRAKGKSRKKAREKKKKEMHNNVSKLTNLILICVCVGDTSTKNGLFQENKSQLIIHTAASAFFNPSYHPPKNLEHTQTNDSVPLKVRGNYPILELGKRKNERILDGLF